MNKVAGKVDFLQHKTDSSGSLAVSRAFGDSEVGMWVTAEPYTK